MCGITLTLAPHPLSEHVLELHKSLASANAIRGPDTTRTVAHVVPLPGGGAVQVCMTASVLGLRGQLTGQPIDGQRGILAWNGQVFDGLNLAPSENDTKRIFQLLEDGTPVDQVLSSVEGPYAFVYFNKVDRTLRFQIDPLSRRSLLIHMPTPSCPALTLSSTRSAYARENGMSMRVLLGGEGSEVLLDKVQISKQGERPDEAVQLDISAALHLHGCEDSGQAEAGPSTWRQIPTINTQLPPRHFIPSASHAQEHVPAFVAALQASVRRRIENIPPANESGLPRVAILFSGGVDCTLLAVLVHRCLPPGEPVDLINVAFQRQKPPDKESAKAWKKSTSTPSNTGAHEASRSSKPSALALASTPSEYDVPDRISGRDALEEVQATCKGREWRFVEINVTTEEYQSHRQRVIDLMYPCTSEMDLSLAYPLYFASRGIGSLGGQPYTVRAKVYISGLGPDEQLGGYARHRQSYRLTGFPGLLTSLAADIASLPARNTARDDRILSSHARDARYPYLDLSLVRFVAALPVWSKVCYELDGVRPSAGDGDGDGGGDGDGRAGAVVGVGGGGGGGGGEGSRSAEGRSTSGIRREAEAGSAAAAIATAVVNGPRHAGRQSSESQDDSYAAADLVRKPAIDVNDQAHGRLGEVPSPNSTCRVPSASRKSGGTTHDTHDANDTYAHNDTAAETMSMLGDKLLLRLAADHLGLHRAARRSKRAMQFGSRSARAGEGGGVRGAGAGKRQIGE